MGGDLKWPDFSDLSRRCSLGDTYAPLELLQHCIEALTCFEGTFPSDMRLSLVEKVQGIFTGVQFIVSGDDDKQEAARLKGEIDALHGRIQASICDIRRLRDTLQIKSNDLQELEQEATLLKEIAAYDEIRRGVKDKYLDNSSYLDALSQMKSRLRNTEHLQDLEKQCVKLLEEIAAIFAGTLNSEEEAWQIKQKHLSSTQ